MKKQIFKYELGAIDRNIIMLPLGSEILSIQVQRGVPCIWVLVNPENQKEERWFEIFGTGHEISFDVERKFIGTFQLNEATSLVFHLFERL